MKKSNPLGITALEGQKQCNPLGITALEGQKQCNKAKRGAHRLTPPTGPVVKAKRGAHPREATVYLPFRKQCAGSSLCENFGRPGRVPAGHGTGERGSKISFFKNFCKIEFSDSGLYGDY